MRVDYGREQLNDLIERLRRRLPDYLKEKGIIGPDWTVEANTDFRCLNPVHTDNNPSMHFIPSSEGQRLYCFPCGKAADIFQAAVWLEGLPVNGPDWVRENVYHLAKVLGEEYEESAPSEDEMRRAKILEMLADAADVLYGVSKTNPDFCFQHTRARGLTDEICLEAGVGTVDLDFFLDQLEKFGGWDKEFAKENGIRATHFGGEHITITLRDMRGVVIGFDRRFVYYNSEEAKLSARLDKPYPRKYMQPERSAIFNPETFIYGLDVAKTESWKTLEMFEGYFSVLSARQAGLRCCGAMTGLNKLDKARVSMLARTGFRDLCLVTDSDAPGQKAIENYIESLKEQNELRICFRLLGWRPQDEVPEKERDPDTFFRLYCKKSLEQYEKMPVISIFQMALEVESRKGVGGDQLARAQVVHIANESDPFQRGKMIRSLSERTSVPEADIRAVVEGILDSRSQKIIKDAARQMSDSSLTPREAISLMNKTQSRLASMLQGRNDVVTVQAAKAVFYSAVDQFFSQKGVVSSWKTGIPWYDDNFGGYPRGGFFAFGGSPNTGKSAFAHMTVCGLMRNRDQNPDLCVVFFSFDDVTVWSWAKQFAVWTGLPIEWCANPKEHILSHPDRARLYKDAQAFYQDCVGKNIVMFGGDVGANVHQIDRAIQLTQQATGKNLLIVVDSFNKIQGIDGLSGTPMFERNADALHGYVHNGMAVMVTAEITKGAMGFKPTPQDFKDCGKLLYNANVNVLLYNPLNDLRDQSKFFWVMEEPSKPGEHRKAAVIQSDIWKNRIGSYKGSDVFKFYDNIGRMERIKDINSFMAEQRALWQKVGKSNLIGSQPKPGNSPFAPPPGSAGKPLDIDL